MHARRVSLNLKPNSAAEFTERLEKEVETIYFTVSIGGP